MGTTIVRMEKAVLKEGTWMTTEGQVLGINRQLKEVGYYIE